MLSSTRTLLSIGRGRRWKGKILGKACRAVPQPVRVEMSKETHHHRATASAGCTSGPSWAPMEEQVPALPGGRKGTTMFTASPNPTARECCTPRGLWLHTLAGIITTGSSGGFAFRTAANSVSLCARYEMFRSDFTSKILLGMFLAEVAGIASPASYLGLTLQNNPSSMVFFIILFSYSWVKVLSVKYWLSKSRSYP